MAPIQGAWRAARTPLGYFDSARRTEDPQRASPETEAALEVLKRVLPASDYCRMESEWRNGQREIRLEGGFIVTCFTPAG